MLAVDADESLLARCRARDLTALAELYDRHHGYAYAAVLNLTGDAACADCAVAAAFQLLWRDGFSRNPARLPIREWLVRVALSNCLRDRERRPAPSS